MVAGGSVARLVVQVPEQDAVIAGEVVENPFDIAFQPSPERGIVDDAEPGRLNPAGVVGERFRLGLFPQFRIRLPAVVEKDEHGFDPMLRREGKILFHAAEETGGILFPEEIVQKDAHQAHADRSRPAEFPVDRGGIKSFRLPHFQLIDGCARSEIGSEAPLSVPMFQFFHLTVS